MVGQRTLTPLILVRIQAKQPTQGNARKGVFLLDVLSLEEKQRSESHLAPVKVGAREDQGEALHPGKAAIKSYLLNLKTWFQWF